MADSARREVFRNAADPDLVRALLKRKGLNLPSTEDIPRRESKGACVTSFAQQRLWFHCQWDPKSSVYNSFDALRISGPLHFDVLEEAINMIVRRHEALRTVFPADDGNPLQHILPFQPFVLPLVDLGSLIGEPLESEWRRLAIMEADQPFDLEQGPLFRFLLLSLSEEETILIINMHHIITDGQSLEVFYRELSALYAALISGQKAELADLPIQYADYALWERERLQSRAFIERVEAWSREFEHAPDLLALPTDYRRPTPQTFRGASFSFSIDQAIYERLKLISREAGATPFMTLLAAFKVLLHRYTGQDDLLVGTMMANRSRPEFQNLIGFFVNDVPIRTNLSGNPTFAELLRRTKEAAQRSYSHQDVPFERLIEEVRPDRDTSHDPLIQVAMVMETREAEDSLNLPGLTITPLEFESRTAKFDLTLTMREIGPELQAFIEYRSDLFDAERIERMAGHMQVLLGEIAADPGKRIGQLELLGEAERRLLLEEWNQVEVEGEEERCLHELLEEQVRERPDGIALVYEGEHLSYGALNRRANQLARYLKGLGVGPEKLVGVMMERSLEMVVGLVGILKAGGAYVPLDPSYPVERLAYMMEDTGALVMLTQEQLVRGLPEHGARVVALDGDWGEIEGESEENPQSGVGPENLAYVIYTSGSTGQPKGVAVEQTSLSNHSKAMSDMLDIGPEDRLLRVINLGFDAAAEEFYPTLICGATLVIFPDKVISGQGILTVCNEHSLTLLHLPAALWHVFVDVLERSSDRLLRPPRILLVEGERPSRACFETWQNLTNGQSRFFNLYGPTEATITATAFEMLASSPTKRELRQIPIGKPIANLQAHVLDANSNLVPVGVPGELHLAGMGLARGYVNRSGQTTDCFVPNPYSSFPGDRMYRTGDLVRWLPNGDIEFLDREDRQVKIRGYRIELQEIEVHLGQHPEVLQAVVMAFQHESREKTLVAYIVAKDGAKDSAEELREHLRSRLPSYMVPQVFIEVEEMPLTPNGKIDRKKLPIPTIERRREEQAYSPPRTAMEKRLAQIWGAILDQDRIGRLDNFFDIGGSSLLVSRMIARLGPLPARSEFLQAFFKEPILWKVAAILEDTLDGQDPAHEEDQGGRKNRSDFVL